MARKAVLFDLDGTFADTAADLVRALNRLRAARGLPDLPVPDMRQYASAGARGLIVAGLQMLPDHPDYTATREEFLKHYSNEICVDTQLFPGIVELLSAIEARGLRWGIVTNKSTALTRQLLEEMRLIDRPILTIQSAHELETGQCWGSPLQKDRLAVELLAVEQLAVVEREQRQRVAWQETPLLEDWKEWERW